MKVRVEFCWGGHKGKWLLRTPNGHRYYVHAREWSHWTRAVAREALDLLEAEGYTRRNVRFDHY